MDPRFTSDELALLTPFDAIAYDLARVDADPEILPCWLVFSDQAREDARLHAEQTLRDLGMSRAEFNSKMGPAIDPTVRKWLAVEYERKQARARNEPAGWFA